MASQARHESVSPKETSASRYVVPQERVFTSDALMSLRGPCALTGSLGFHAIFGLKKPVFTPFYANLRFREAPRASVLPAGLDDDGTLVPALKRRASFSSSLRDSGRRVEAPTVETVGYYRWPLRDSQAPSFAILRRGAVSAIVGSPWADRPEGMGDISSRNAATNDWNPRVTAAIRAYPRITADSGEKIKLVGGLSLTVGEVNRICVPLDSVGDRETARATQVAGFPRGAQGFPVFPHISCYFLIAGRKKHLFPKKAALSVMR